MAPQDDPAMASHKSDSSVQDDESSRRRAVYQALQSALSSEEMHRALLLCNQEFPPDRTFIAAEFCQRLAETIPDVQLDKETRLHLLRTMRQPAQELGVDPLPLSGAADPDVAEPVVAELVMADDEADGPPCQDDRPSPEIFWLRYKAKQEKQEPQPAGRAIQFSTGMRFPSLLTEKTL